MSEYHKIHTLFKRDPSNKYKTLLLDEYSLPEFEYLKDNQWLFEEKVDGTNIRIEYTPLGEHTSMKASLAFKGRTERAQIPPKLYEVLMDLFSIEVFDDYFSNKKVVLYGEGFGGNIQKAGKLYNSEPTFVLFDVSIDGWWLDRENMRDIARNIFNVSHVPEIGQGTLNDMLHYVRDEGVQSAWGDFTAEGIVARPSVELKSRNGHRIITKLKHKDFTK